MDDFASVFKTWSLPILVLDRELNIAYCNAAYEAATQRTLSKIQGHYVFEIFPETNERVESVRHLFLKAFEGETTSMDEVRFNLLGEDGITTERVWQATQEPYRNSEGQVHERLMRSGMISVDLKHLLEDEIKGVASDMESTVNLQGPSTLLYAELSRSFSMLIHELATNAVKYGCFSTANGALDVKWDVKDETTQYRPEGLLVTITLPLSAN